MDGDKDRGLDVADGAMLATTLIWAGNNVIVKAALDQLSPLPYVFGRFALVVVLLFAWLRLRRVDLRIERADVGRFVFSGLTGYALYNLLFTVGLEHTSAFSAALLISLGPVFVLVFARLLRLERIGFGQWVGVGCAGAGVVLFVSDKLRGEAPALGDLFSLLAAAIWAAFSLGSRPLVRRYGAPAITAWSALIGLVAIVPVTLPGVLREDWAAVEPSGWASLVYSAAIAMLVGYTLWGWAIARRGVGRTAPYMYLVPIATGAFSVLFLEEGFGPLKIAGAALALAGVGLARRAPKPRPGRAPEQADRRAGAARTDGSA